MIPEPEAIALIRQSALVFALILVAASTHATDSRITALGEGSAFYEDDRGVMRWYGSLADYPDLLAVESGHFSSDDGYKGPYGQRMSGPGAGAHLQFDENGSWGTGAIYWQTRGDDADPGSLRRGYLGTHWSFLWAKDFDEGVTVGLMWRNADETRSSWPGGDLVRGRQEAGFGLRLDLGERAYLDTAGEARRYTNRAEGTDEDGQPWKTPGHDSWDNFGFRTRVFWQISERLVLVPLIEYVGEGYDAVLAVDDGVEDAPVVTSGTLWRLGCGLNFLRDTDNLVVLSADYIDGAVDHDFTTVSPDDPTSLGERYRAFLGKAALERRLAYWLVGRFAVGYEHLDQGGDFLHPESGSTLLISGGVGIQLGDYVLDLALAGREPRGFSRYAPTIDEEEDKLWMSATFRWDF